MQASHLSRYPCRCKNTTNYDCHPVCVGQKCYVLSPMPSNIGIGEIILNKQVGNNCELDVQSNNQNLDESDIFEFEL